MFSTYIHVSPEMFFAFVLLVAIVQSGTGSYLQISVIAMASLFGPMAIQAVMSGQAAVAVVVSGVQVLSAAVSIWGQPPETLVAYKSDGKAEEKSAFIFFMLSAVFLIASVGAHAWLASLPTYKVVIVPFDQRKELGQLAQGHTSLEDQDLMSGGREEDAKGRILRVAKANVIYEVAVAYVFIVTLVSARPFMAIFPL
jgi:equilibrative nucleoside transporter 1/2/3